MIIRMWRGRTFLEKANAYEGVLKRLAIPDYSSVEGFQAYYFTRRDHETYAEFLLITHWDSIDAIKGFAGEDYSKANIMKKTRTFCLISPNMSSITKYSMS